MITIFFFVMNHVLDRYCINLLGTIILVLVAFFDALLVGLTEAFGERTLVYRRLNMGLTSTSIGNNESFLSHFGHIPLFCEIISSGGLSSLPSYKT